VAAFAAVVVGLVVYRFLPKRVAPSEQLVEA
jgi:hypothetical protein